MMSAFESLLLQALSYSIRCFLFKYRLDIDVYFENLISTLSLTSALLQAALFLELPKVS